MFEGITFIPELPPADQMFKSKTVIETLCLGHYIHVDAYGYIVWMSTGHSLHNTSNANPFTNLQRVVLFIQAYHDWERRNKEGDSESHEAFLKKHKIEIESEVMPPQNLTPDENELWRFQEPHVTGGDATVTITRRKAIEYMRQDIIDMCKREGRDLKDLDDEAVLGEFIVNYWAHKIEEEKVKVATTAA